MPIRRSGIQGLQVPLSASYNATVFHLPLTPAVVEARQAGCLLKRILLAFLLLVAQHAAALHALGHSFERDTDGAPVAGLHAGCLGLHGIDDVPVARGTAKATPPEFSAALPDPPASLYVARVLNPYLSRAPPAIS